MTLHRPFAAALAAAAFACLLPAAAPAQVQPGTTPEGSLYGAPGTPDISGIWQVTNSGSNNWTPYPPAYRPEYQARFEEWVAADEAGAPLADPGARCLPHGLPTALMFSGYPIEIIQTPGRVTVIKELLAQTWRIWTDGRPLPEEIDPSFLGQAVGHWEDDTLVVEIVGLRDDTLLDARRTMPHSTDLRIVQRWRKLDPDTLELKMTAEDPTAFEGVLETTVLHTRWLDQVLMEHFCEAPGFDISEDGQFAPIPDLLVTD